MFNSEWKKQRNKQAYKKMINKSRYTLKSFLFQIAAGWGEGLYFGTRPKATVRADFNKIIKIQC